MLHTQTIERKTLELLKALMLDPQLGQFALVGGTALALYMGHRLSIDIDLFSPEPFDAPQMAKYMIDRYGFLTDMLEKNTLKGGIDDVKIDLITHDYPTLRSYTVEDGIRLYSREDIAAMKLSAIADSGTRLKDFIDIAFLSTLMSLNEMVAAYEKKYPNSNPVRTLKGLGYHDDIRFEEKIELLIGAYSWNAVRQRLTKMARFPSIIFTDYPISLKEK